ncbi:MAG: helix-turn-helix domain-containing protein, partial [Henriciella sp.]
PWLDLRTAVGQGILGLMSSLAQDERERIVARAQQGRILAKEKGVKFGRKPKLTEYQRDRARERRAAGESTREIAKDYDVSHSTISRL